MKRSAWVRILAIVLAFSMLAPVTASAATLRGSAYGTRQSIADWLRERIESLVQRRPGSTEETEATEQTEATEETEAVTEESNTVQTMTLIEDASTVENSDMLRASTYALTTTSSDGTATAAETTTTTLKYFPITLYNYDTDTINTATLRAEVDAGLQDTEKWEGIYFNTSTGWVDDWDNYTKSYTYYTSEPTWTSESVSYNNRNDSTYTSGSYAYLTDGEYLTVSALSCSRSGWNGNYTYTWTIIAGGQTFTASTSSITLYKSSADSVKLTKTFEAWNWYDKTFYNSDSTALNGDLIYTGLVEPTLDANKNIVFTKVEGGIFNDDATVKDIYTNVELPFVYDSTTGYYTFDSDTYGVYFHEDETQGSTAAASNGRLYFDEKNLQYYGWYTSSTDNDRYNLWAPFNDTFEHDGTTQYLKWGEAASIKEDPTTYMDYHFGMSATIPFTMTSDGYVHEGVEGSGAIQFSFSGDDDVWVFIDGQLVIDLGGIHNRLDAVIDFAANTVTYSEDNDNADTTYTTGSFNDSSFETTQILFGGLIAQDRASFAATDNHELTIYYLERGEVESNCQIKFNLPVKDTVSVHKTIDGFYALDDNGNYTITDMSNLPKEWTEEKLAVLNNLDFTFTLYKNDAVVANETYLLLNANGQVIATPSTDANGQFVLKNGQTAKFTGTISTEGDEFYVVENIKNGFIYTDYSYSANCFGSDKVDNASLNNYTYYKKSGAHYVTNMDYSDGTLESGAVNVIGGEESEDALSFVCKNYVNASLPTPSAIAADDKVVIDYGLDVVIDLFSNDLYVGDSAEISFPDYAADDNGVYTAAYGTFTFDSTTNCITYKLNKQLTGVEVINYTLTAVASSQSNSDTANVYIIPATTMYYEEDFTGLVNYVSGTWSTAGTAQADPQEPGVVGTVGDSPYGSDAAYLNDSGDSNGSSEYVSTDSAEAKFSYTFTGTGTTFFARTSNTSGNMYVKVTDENGTVVYEKVRDTSYKSNTSATLYNIPVFTWTVEDSLEQKGFDLGYGTYTVTVTISQSWGIYGTDFWLDGIRVVNPLNSNDTNAAIAQAAYSTDAEANMTHITLRDKLLVDAAVYNESDELVWVDDTFVVFTDTNGEIRDASEYESNGPKEEVYLNDGQSVTFSIADWDPNSYFIYLGVKAPFGSGTVSINGHTVTINNAADCYYEIGTYAAVTKQDVAVTDEAGNEITKTIYIATFEIQATSSLISVTNIKVTGNNPNFVIFNNILYSDDVTVDGSEGEG